MLRTHPGSVLWRAFRAIDAKNCADAIVCARTVRVAKAVSNLVRGIEARKIGQAIGQMIGQAARKV
jgi:hypothetical protein